MPLGQSGWALSLLTALLRSSYLSLNSLSVGFYMKIYKESISNINCWWCEITMHSLNRISHIMSLEAKYQARCCGYKSRHNNLCSWVLNKVYKDENDYTHLETVRPSHAHPLTAQKSLGRRYTVWDKEVEARHASCSAWPKPPVILVKPRTKPHSAYYGEGRLLFPGITRYYSRWSTAHTACNSPGPGTV